ncbi:membrane-associated proteins in eicosanoid and glutathione metabolism [Amniculicola lignicola CBS 123094]|uniref:Membrane-associated proteins in eicosanoid and glutathione metabolism n=1 Tax=Amniculicola lignicola CBS 123094 TaxID=1392246 RepID=A0A6A5WTI5_9PLEO|nr:membrane-associated proteins in eicosanoid and glutathione metabolism [Amniculicola lignicola CBS 123094]
MDSIQLPAEYGFVLAAAVSTCFIATFHGTRVGGLRKAAKVPYPYEYASYEQVSTASPAAAKAMDTFNRCQRSHQNFNENHPSFLVALLVAGLKWPRASAVMGLVWGVNRVIYSYGYTDGQAGGKGRYKGAGWMVMQYGLVIMGAWSAVELALKAL